MGKKMIIALTIILVLVCSTTVIGTEIPSDTFYLNNPEKALYASESRGIETSFEAVMSSIQQGHIVLVKTEDWKVLAGTFVYNGIEYVIVYDDFLENSCTIAWKALSPTDAIELR